jgi:phosphoribosylglycinamide formyltransferase-1
MKLAVFCYTFGTRKTQEGLAKLALYGFLPSLMLAAPPVEFTFYRSARIAPRGLSAESPKALARYYGIRYIETPHNDGGCGAMLRHCEIDAGVILGARILKQPTIDAVRYGIINLHPGQLPENRGLDNIKWAILEGLPQVATAHYIDAAIDRGRFLCERRVSVFRDDTLLDLHFRVQDAERDVMIRALQIVEKEPLPERYLPLGTGSYHRAVPAAIERILPRAFDVYKNICGEP